MNGVKQSLSFCFPFFPPVFVSSLQNHDLITLGEYEVISAASRMYLDLFLVWVLYLFVPSQENVNVNMYTVEKIVSTVISEETATPAQ